MKRKTLVNKYSDNMRVGERQDERVGRYDRGGVNLQLRQGLAKGRLQALKLCKLIYDRDFRGVGWTVTLNC